MAKKKYTREVPSIGTVRITQKPFGSGGAVYGANFTVQTVKPCLSCELYHEGEGNSLQSAIGNLIENCQSVSAPARISA